MFNENKFRGKVAENRMTLTGVADKLGINAVTLNRKMNGQSDFTRAEIQELRSILCLDAHDVESIFFST